MVVIDIEALQAAVAADFVDSEPGLAVHDVGHREGCVLYQADPGKPITERNATRARGGHRDICHPRVGGTGGAGALHTVAATDISGSSCVTATRQDGGKERNSDR